MSVERWPLVGTARALVELSRPGNVAMAAIGVAIGALVASGGVTSVPVAWAAVATMLVTAGGNALNDVTDREVDEAAHPDRPLPSGRLTPGSAFAFAIAAFLTALVAAWLVSPALFGLVLAAEAVLFVYEGKLKAVGLAGNLVVAGLVALTFVAGSLATGRVTAPVGFLAGLSLLANVGREVYKDIEDAAHDRGRQTLAQRWGPARARRFAHAATVLGILLSPVPFLLGFGGWPYLVTVLLADAVFLWAVLAPSPARAQRRSKIAMVLALVAFGLGGFL